MGRQRESRLSGKIMGAIRDQGHFCFKIHGNEYMLTGLPDIIVCVDGYFIGLEVKRPETRYNVSRRQEYIHTMITRSGGIARVVTSPEEALEVIDQVRARQIDP